MQQRCTNCGNPIQPGNPVCTTCGAPVSAGGGGYDPTMQAGYPGTGYGSQPYGPSSSPYGAPPPPPPPNYGYGAPPPPPGYTPQPGFSPQPVMMAPPPQKRSNTVWYLLGGCLVVVILVCIGSYFVLRAAGIAFVNTLNNVATQIATNLPNEHISGVKIGTGDSNSGNISNETTSFRTSDTIIVDFTVTTQDSNGEVELKVLDSNGQVVKMGHLNPPAGTRDGFFAFSIESPGSYTAELQYNNATEQTVEFTVSS